LTAGGEPARRITFRRARWQVTTPGTRLLRRLEEAEQSRGIIIPDTAKAPAEHHAGSSRVSTPGADALEVKAGDRVLLGVVGTGQAGRHRYLIVKADPGILA
jgi:co-chaperonin GroES (HSP10)